MALALSDLRSLAQFYCRNAADSSMYSATNLDYALMLAGEEWCRIVHPRKLGTITLAASSSTLSGLPSDWLPEYHLNHTLFDPAGDPLWPNVEFTDYNEVMRMRLLNGGSTSSGATGIRSGTPSAFGFPSNSTAGGIIDVICDQSYSMYLWYWKPFPTWTAGGTAASDAFAHIPDAQLRVIATDGVMSRLQINEPQNNGLAVQAGERFRNAMWQFKGIDSAGRGGQVTSADDPDDLRSSPVLIPRG